MIERIVSLLLGPRCVCGQRVFPKDRVLHIEANHGWPV